MNETQRLSANQLAILLDLKQKVGRVVEMLRGVERRKQVSSMGNEEGREELGAKVHYFSPRIPIELLERVKAEAARRHMQLEDVAEEALERWLEWSTGFTSEG